MKRIYIIAIALMLVLLVGCSSEEVQQPKSIADIQEAEGIPVKIDKVKTSKLERWEEFQSTLEGAKESEVFGLLSDNLFRINVSLGDYVEAGEVIAEYSTESPTAKYTQAFLAKDIAEKTYNRMLTVYNAGGISRQDLDNVKTQYDVAIQDFRAVSKMVKVQAPISGIVSEINYDEGDFCSPSSPLAKIVDSSVLKATITVDETKINNFKKNLPAVISWDAIGGKTFKGKVTAISLSANPQKRGFAVDVMINNHNNELKAGAFVTVKVNTKTNAEAIIINRLSVVTENNKDYVYVVKNDKAVKQKVVTGDVVSDKIEIISGLTLNDSYVVEGQSRVKDGIKVNIVKTNQS